MRRGTVPGEWVGGGAGPELRKGIEDNLRSLAVDHLTVVISIALLIITRVRRKRVYGGLVWPWFSSPGARWC